MRCQRPNCTGAIVDWDDEMEPRCTQCARPATAPVSALDLKALNVQRWSSHKETED